MVDIYTLVLFGNLILLAGGASLPAEAVRRPTRIVNGRDVGEGEITWQISLQWGFSDEMRAHFCGGALVAPSWVVTAAHCVKKSYITPQSLVIVFNATNMKVDRAPKAEVENIFIADYDDRTKANDIALIKLKSPVTINGLAHLPDSDYEAEGSCVVSGWGYETLHGGVVPDQLKAANVTVITDSKCQELFGPKYPIQSTMLCAGGGDTDACQGDSGGPLICHGPNNQPFLAGIVSWGIGCATPDKPGVYTEVSKYRRWIDALMKSN